MYGQHRRRRHHHRWMDIWSDGWLDGWMETCLWPLGNWEKMTNSPILLVVQFCYRYFKYLWSSQEWWNVVVFFFFVRDAMLSTVHHFWMITLLVDIIGLIFLLLLLLLYEMFLVRRELTTCLQNVCCYRLRPAPAPIVHISKKKTSSQFNGFT